MKVRCTKIKPGMMETYKPVREWIIIEVSIYEPGTGTTS
jgi:hypothetical protein